MNVNGWFARTKDHGSTQRKHKIVRYVECHKLEIAGVQKTHFKDSKVVDGQR